jgi:carbon storage regulator CsrA
MLVLNRDWGDRILIGDDIEIVVIEPIGRRGARVAIHAPKDVQILRKEIAHKYKDRQPDARKRFRRS